jgi:hypothetical protein
VNDWFIVPPSYSTVLLLVSKPFMDTTIVISPHESGLIVSGVVPLLLPSISTVAPLGVDVMTSCSCLAGAAGGGGGGGGGSAAGGAVLAAGIWRGGGGGGGAGAAF